MKSIIGWINRDYILLPNGQEVSLGDVLIGPTTTIPSYRVIAVNPENNTLMYQSLINGMQTVTFVSPNVFAGYRRG